MMLPIDSSPVRFDDAIEKEMGEIPEVEVPDIPEPDYGASDYLRLPNFGWGYYSLVDAALVAALDMWTSGKIQGGPEEWPEPEGTDNAEVRAAVEPTRRQIVAALVRSVEAGQLEAEVRRRNLANSELIPERTFIDLQALTDWLEIHGHDRGDFLAEIDEAEMENPWITAHQVAEDRARFRFGYSAKSIRLSANEQSVDELNNVIRDQRLRIAYLEEQHRNVRNETRSKNMPEKAVSTRQWRTLLAVIAGLCKKARIPLDRNATSVIRTATEDNGAPVGEDAIREIVRGIPEALDSRNR